MEPYRQLVEERRAFGERLKSLTPYWYLIALPRNTVVRTLNAADVAPGERGENRSTLSELRKTYPIKRNERHDDDLDMTVTVTSLEEPTESPSIPESIGRDRMGQLAETFGNGRTAIYQDRYGDSNQSQSAASNRATAQWSKPSHVKIANIAAGKEGYSSNPGAIGNFADDPDNDPITPPSFLSQYEKQYTRMVMSYNHYYNPDKFRGDAPNEARRELVAARDLYPGNKTAANEKVGRGIHYFQDVAQSLHTGLEIEQGADYALNGSNAIHFLYENYVNAELRDANDPRNFTSAMKNSTGSLSAASPTALAISLAAASNLFSSTVFYAIAGGAINNWQNNLASIARASLVNSMKASRGAIRYMKS
jgi:hypothetical protein